MLYVHIELDGNQRPNNIQVQEVEGPQGWWEPPSLLGREREEGEISYTHLVHYLDTIILIMH